MGSSRSKTYKLRYLLISIGRYSHYIYIHTHIPKKSGRLRANLHQLSMQRTCVSELPKICVFPEKSRTRRGEFFRKSVKSRPLKVGHRQLDLGVPQFWTKPCHIVGDAYIYIYNTYRHIYIYTYPYIPLNTSISLFSIYTYVYIYIYIYMCNIQIIQTTIFIGYINHHVWWSSNHSSPVLIFTCHNAIIPKFCWFNPHIFFSTHNLIPWWPGGSHLFRHSGQGPTSVAVVVVMG